MSLSLADAINKVNAIFGTYPGPATSAPLVPAGWLEGKVYEAWVLAVVLENLSVHEGFSVKLVGGTMAHLKSGGGPINPSYPRFQLSRPGGPVLEVWTDIEFSTMSYSQALSAGMAGTTPGKAHKHELDIVVVDAGTVGYPSFNDVIIGVECKNTAFEKSMARAALGVRRELSFLRTPKMTLFQHWPRQFVPAAPASIVLVYSTDAAVVDYNEAGQMYGVDFVHEPIV